MNKKEIRIFSPPKFVQKKIDFSYLNRTTNQQIQYASKGRFALKHILSSFPEIDSILLPAYACNIILSTVKKLGIGYDFYDIDSSDLNADISSIINIAEKTGVKAILVASMYGNPADLFKIEQFCISKNIVLIDDAAQSFGAKLDDRHVGTFGNAGFFSFSPGKPTAGHMGAFFWTTNILYKINYVHHNLIHKIIYLDYYFNRLNIYKYRKYHIFKLLRYINIAFFKFIDLSNDNIANFEKGILGGILESMNNGDFDFRQSFFNKFYVRFEGNDLFKIVKAKRGIPNNHKIVIVCSDKTIANDIIDFCLKKNIYASNGYALLTDKLDCLPVSRIIDGCIVEFPIEDDVVKMNYLFDVIDKFIQFNELKISKRSIE